jgi:hypothetical protein
MNNQGTQRVIVTIKPEHQSDIHSIAKSLESSGLRVTQVLKGYIVGDIDQAKQHAILSRPEVKGLEPEGRAFMAGDASANA